MFVRAYFDPELTVTCDQYLVNPSNNKQLSLNYVKY